MRLLQKTRLDAPPGALPTKETLFHAIRLDRSRIHDNERTIRPVGMGVNVARGDFLPGPGRTRQHNPSVRLGDLVQLPFQRTKCRRASDHLGCRDVLASERRVLAPQP